MPSDFFTYIGQQVCKALADRELVKHLAGPMARDQGLGSRPMKTGPRYDQALISRCIAGLTDPQQQQMLVEGLQNLLESDGGNGGNCGNGGGMDSIRANNKGALDRNIRRRPAQDRALSPEVRALNASSFNRRWGALTKGIRFTPN